MAVQTLNSRPLSNAVVAVTSDDASANRPHRYEQLQIMNAPQAGDGSVIPRPSPTVAFQTIDYTAVAAWTAARIAADVTIDTAAISWSR
jgi:hypothetical protein